MLAIGVCQGSEQTQFGIGYSREFRKNTDIAQVELFYRHPLPFTNETGSGWHYFTALEYGAAVLYDGVTKRTETGRLSVMGEIFLSPGNFFILFGGIGTGFMVGDTELTGQDLGGPWLISSKLGFQLLFSDHWGAEYCFYHQSNGGVYDLNSGLNMNHISITYQF